MSQAGTLSGGGGGGGSITLNGDTGSAVGSNLTINGLTNGGSVSFDAAGTTVVFNPSDGNLNTYFGNGTPTINLGQQNTAFGQNALKSADVLSGYNVAIGNDALDSVVGAQFNMGIGRYAFGGNSTDIGNNNTGVGYFAGQGKNGSDNTAIGYAAMGFFGPDLTCSYNVCIGSLAGSVFNSNESSNVLIANVGVASESNTMRLGTTGVGAGQQNQTYIAGIFGTTVNAGTGVPVVIDSTELLGTVLSSQRYKKNIHDIGLLSKKIYDLKPVRFNYIKYSETESYGLIAEQVQEVFEEIVVKNKDGEPETVRYIDLIPMLVNELKCIKLELDELKNRLSV